MELNRREILIGTVSMAASAALPGVPSVAGPSVPISSVPYHLLPYHLTAAEIESLREAARRMHKEMDAYFEAKKAKEAANKA